VEYEVGRKHRCALVLTEPIRFSTALTVVCRASLWHNDAYDSKMTLEKIEATDDARVHS
jgi:hypothetical protein